MAPGETADVAEQVGYEIILSYSHHDQSFIAMGPDLPGCAADGSTYQEAFANVEVAIREWIETAQELGRVIPEPRGRLAFARVSRNSQPMTSVRSSAGT
jgi:predicted RNase H-like HicB family nuclease